MTCILKDVFTQGNPDVHCDVVFLWCLTNIKKKTEMNRRLVGATYSSRILTNGRCWQSTQGGMLGMALDCEWGEPLTNSGADTEAAERHVQFQMGW